MTKTRGFQAPNYTQIPNELIALMPDMKETELRITLAIARKTFGWQKHEDRISLTQLQQLTGLSRQGVIDGIAAGVERGTIKKHEHKAGAYAYALVVNTVDQDGQHSRPEVVNTVDTQKKEKKLTKESADDIAPEAEKPKREQKADPIFDAVALKFFGISDSAKVNGTGGRIAKAKKAIKEVEPMVTAAQVGKFSDWYKEKYPKADLPRDGEKIKVHWLAWQQASEAASPAWEKDTDEVELW